jgi:hypothetical protein
MLNKPTSGCACYLRTTSKCTAEKGFSNSPFRRLQNIDIRGVTNLWQWGLLGHVHEVDNAGVDHGGELEEELVGLLSAVDSVD